MPFEQVEQLGPRQTMHNDEVGLAYIVWRFLLKEPHAAIATSSSSSVQIRRLYTQENLQVVATTLLNIAMQQQYASQDWTFVHLAAAYGDEDCLVAILQDERSANMINTRTCLEGFTPLHLASFYGYPAIVTRLLQTSSQLWFNIDKLLGRSPLHYAAFLGFVDIVKLLIEKWGNTTDIADLQDKQGWTPLHLAVIPTFKSDQERKEVIECLLAVAKYPNKTIRSGPRQDVELISRLLIERKRKKNSACRVLIPTPNLAALLVWGVPGATPLHLLYMHDSDLPVKWRPGAADSIVETGNHGSWQPAVPEAAHPDSTTLMGADHQPRPWWGMMPEPSSIGTPTHPKFTIAPAGVNNTWGSFAHIPPSCASNPVMQDRYRIKDHIINLLSSKCDVNARDCEGVLPYQYYASRHRDTADGYHIHMRERRPGIKQLSERKIAYFRTRMNRVAARFSIFAWIYVVGVNLLSGDYTAAEALVNDLESEATDSKPKISDGYLENEGWDHLEWAFNQAMGSYKPGYVKSANMVEGNVRQVQGNQLHLPRLHPADAEEMIITLLSKRPTLGGQYALQRCLLWAIDKGMERLAEELVNNKRCELLTVVPGCEEYKEAPMAIASRRNVLKRMPRLVAAMELRKDVRNRCYEDRQVYVDYANTLLVGAVLIAGLAFAGWLQPPKGYTDGKVSMKSISMKLFVCSSILSFFLAMGTVVAGAVGAIPFGTGQLVGAHRRLHRVGTTSSFLLAASVTALATSFCSATISVLPAHYRSAVTSFNALCALVLGLMLIWFVKRLLDLQIRYANVPR